MRYVKPLRKVLVTGSKAMMSSALRHQISQDKPLNKISQQYPIFFMHGFMGFSEMKVLNIKLFDYFNGVKNILEQMGYTVYCQSINPMLPAQKRATEWVKHIDKVLLDTRAEKIHIIAHNQGCLDARVLAATSSHHCKTPHHGELYGQNYSKHIASITSIAGPHLGTPLADPVYDDENNEIMIDIVGLIAMMTGSSNKTAKQTIDAMSRNYMLETFNPAIKVPNTIPCYTVVGNPANEQDLSSVFDISWQKIMDTAIEDGGGENDGFVPVSSARFDGNKTTLADSETLQWQNIGEVNADHIALVGIPMEFKENNKFSHLPMYVGLAQRIDKCYKNHIQLALQADGEWQRNSVLDPA